MAHGGFVVEYCEMMTNDLLPNSSIVAECG